MKSCCMIAGEPASCHDHLASLDHILDRLIDDFGIDCFFVGMERGMEQLCAEVLLEKKKTNSIDINCVLTHEEQSSFWKEDDRDRFFSIMERCDQELLLRPMTQGLARFYRDMVMMDLCDFVFLLGSNQELCHWARRHERPVLVFDTEKGTLCPDLRLYRPGIH